MTQILGDACRQCSHLPTVQGHLNKQGSTLATMSCKVKCKGSFWKNIEMSRRDGQESTPTMQYGRHGSGRYRVTQVIWKRFSGAKDACDDFSKTEGCRQSGQKGTRISIICTFVPWTQLRLAILSVFSATAPFQTPASILEAWTCYEDLMPFKGGFDKRVPTTEQSFK